MSIFLFSAMPGMGHLNPMLAIAKQLRAEGHEVIFTAPSPPKFGSEKFISSQGFRFIAIRPRLTFIQFLLIFLLPFTSGFMETFLASQVFFRGIFYFVRAINILLHRPLFCRKRGCCGKWFSIWSFLAWEKEDIYLDGNLLQQKAQGLKKNYRRLFRRLLSDNRKCWWFIQ